MSERELKKFVHVGNLGAELSVDLIEDETGWSPYLSIEDGLRIDKVRLALAKGDIAAANELATVYRLTPVK